MAVRSKNGLPPVWVSQAQIEHVLVNVITNAIQAMPKGGKLTISSSVGERDVRIHVKDTGTGIVKDILDKIFEPLFSTKDKGTGLGLAICQSLLAVNGGSIEVSSEPDRGSLFTIKLPQAT